jgi:competence protein ComEC
MESRRGFLWLPVAFGTGILVYFGLPVEPWLPPLGAATLGLALATWASRHRMATFRALVVATAVVAGLTAAKVRTDLVAAPVLSREATLTVAGWIAGLEAAGNGARALIRVHRVDGALAGPAPHLVRVTIRTGAVELAVGDAVSVLARLTPPSGPQLPGGYDFALPAYYGGLGAYGFALGGARAADIGEAPLDIRLAVPLARLRDGIRRRIEAALPGEAGHIAAALVMGDQGGISEDAQAAMRASGLGHILSISGLHMALVAGSAFWLIRALLALSATLALTRPIRQWAAAGALAVATAYLGISGAAIATQRSYVMLAIMLLAVMVGRRAITLRNVAIAALLILAVAPESLLTASFQMSFAATAALVAAFEAMSRASERRLTPPGRGAIAWLKRHAAGLFLTSLVAGVATAPFAAAHFQRLAPLTLLANVAAMPAIGILVMPMALATVLLMPVGLEAWPLQVMDAGLAWVMAVATATADWSAGYGSVPMMGTGLLLLAVCGFLWLALWGERWRRAGLVPLLAALPLAGLAPRADVIVSPDGTAAAVRADDGRLRILGADAFAAETWLRADGDPRAVDDASVRAGVACDRIGCVAELKGGGTVALVLRPDAFAEDCRLATVVVSRFTAPRGCAARAVVVDEAPLDAGGAHALYRDGDGFRIEAAFPAARRPFMLPAPAAPQ